MENTVLFGDLSEHKASLIFDFSTNQYNSFKRSLELPSVITEISFC